MPVPASTIKVSPAYPDLASQAAINQEALRAIGINAEIINLEASRSRARHFAVIAWERTKWWILIALAGFFFGPMLWSLAMYYGLAPLLSHGRPIRLGPDPETLPQVEESRVSVETVLQPGDVLRIKEKFLQASDEGIGRRTRFVLDWRIPLTSLACGLVELVEMANSRAAGEKRRMPWLPTNRQASTSRRSNRFRAEYSPGL